MQIKTIEKILKKKLDEWTTSITDPDVRSAVKRDTIVTGGSIASMLLNEKVNDIDIYFRTKCTVKKVSKYYADQTKGVVTVIDGAEWVGKYNSENVYDHLTGIDVPDQSQFNLFIKDIEPNRIKLFVKGMNYHSVNGDGSIMAEDDDISINHIFSEIKEAKDETKPGSYSPLFFTANAITLSDQIQLVIRFHGEASELHKNYDFVHATNYYDYYEQKLYVNQPALESLLAKELRYIGSLYPVTSIIRSKKFIKRGWNINAGTYLKIMYQISQLDLSDPAVLHEQTLSVDIAYFSIFIEALSNRDTTKNPNLTYEYVCTLIDKIFN